MEAIMGKQAHIKLWESYYGTVPDGYIIHHINHDHYDNRIENLKIMTDSEHRRYHALNRSDETLKKIGESSKRPCSEEKARKISETMKGRKSALKGKSYTEIYGEERAKEQIKKISDAKSGENHPYYGKKLSEEHRQKLSESRKGEKNPFYGKKHTEETKQKNADAQRRRCRLRST
jgi:hypothetical protein